MVTVATMRFLVIASVVADCRSPSLPWGSSRRSVRSSEVRSLLVWASGTSGGGDNSSLPTSGGGERSSLLPLAEGTDLLRALLEPKTDPLEALAGEVGAPLLVSTLRGLSQTSEPSISPADHSCPSSTTLHRSHPVVHACYRRLPFQ